MSQNLVTLYISKHQTHDSMVPYQSIAAFTRWSLFWIPFLRIPERLVVAVYSCNRTVVQKQLRERKRAARTNSRLK